LTDQPAGVGPQKQPPRRLGRGLDSLLNVPEVQISVSSAGLPESKRGASTSDAATEPSRAVSAPSPAKYESPSDGRFETARIAREKAIPNPASVGSTGNLGLQAEFGGDRSTFEPGRPGTFKPGAPSADASGETPVAIGIQSLSSTDAHHVPRGTGPSLGRDTRAGELGSVVAAPGEGRSALAGAHAGHPVASIPLAPFDLDSSASTQRNREPRNHPTGSAEPTGGTEGADFHAGSTGSGPGQANSTAFSRSVGASSMHPQRAPADVRSLLVQNLPVARVRPNPRQPREDFDEQGLSSLADSIRAAGLMQPIVVRPVGEDNDHVYEIVAGERRWRAIRLLGLETIPAIVHAIDDQTAAEWALIENVQREDLNPIERCSALRRLCSEFGLTHQELASRLGLDRTSITNLLRLGELDAFSKDAVRKRKLTQGHAKALLAITRVDLRQTLAAAAIAGDWSVRELERRVQHALQQAQLSPASAVTDAGRRASAHLGDLERRLGEHVGSRVAIQLGRKKGTGRLVVEFFTLDQFDGLLAKLGFKNES